MSAPYPQTAIRLHLGQGYVLPFVVNGTEETDEETDYGAALVVALGTQTETAKTITLEAYTFDTGSATLDPTHLVYGVGATATRIKSSLTKAELADFAARCFRLTIEASDGEIVRDLEPDANGEFVMQIVPTSATREEIDEMLGPEGLLVVGTDDDSINRLDGETPGGKRLGGVIGKIEVRPADGSPGRSYYGDNLTDTLTEVLGVAGNFVEVWGEVEYEDTGSELFIDIADGVTLVNHGYIHATGGTNPRCFRVPAGRTVKAFNDGLIVMVGVVGDAITTHGSFIVEATAKLVIDGTTDLSNLGITLGTKAVGKVDSRNGYSVLIKGAGGQAYIDGNYFPQTIRVDSVAILVLGPTATYSSISDGGGIIVRGKIFNTSPGDAFLSLIDAATAADIRNTAGASGGIFPSSAGGTGNGFTKFTGPTTSEKTFTLPDLDATLLHGTPNGIVKGDGSGGTSAATSMVDYLAPRFPFRDNRYYFGIGTQHSGSGLALSANVLYGALFPVGETWQPTVIGINVTSTGTASAGRFSIYRVDDTGTPTELVLDCGENSSFGSSTGQKTVNISPTLTRGLYLVCLEVNGTVSVSRQLTTGAEGVMLYGASADGANAVNITASHGYGAAPANFPTMSLNNSFWPAIYMARLTP